MHPASLSTGLLHRELSYLIFCLSCFCCKWGHNAPLPYSQSCWEHREWETKGLVRLGLAPGASHTWGSRALELGQHLGGLSKSSDLPEK